MSRGGGEGASSMSTAFIAHPCFQHLQSGTKLSQALSPSRGVELRVDHAETNVHVIYIQEKNKPKLKHQVHTPGLFFQYPLFGDRVGTVLRRPGAYGATTKSGREHLGKPPTRRGNPLVYGGTTTVLREKSLDIQYCLPTNQTYLSSVANYTTV